MENLDYLIENVWLLSDQIKELEIKLDQLKRQRDELSSQLLPIMESSIPYKGLIFSKVLRKTYCYSQDIYSLELALKERKKQEEREGAPFDVCSHLVVRSPKI